MSSEDRVRRLREMIAQLERMPPSAETERMLREVRARVVDVDTGETPTAMRPADPEPSPPARPRTARRAAPQKAKPEPAPATGLTAAQDREWLSLLAKNEVLSLDDAGQLPSDGDDRRPWTRGLRG